MKLFLITVFVDNGMERFRATWYVFSENRDKAQLHIYQKYGDDLVDIVLAYEVRPEEGMILRK